MSLRRPPEDQRPIADPVDLLARWRVLLVDEPHRTRCLWLLFLGPDARPSGPLITIDDLPDGPYDLQVADLVVFCRDILDGPGGGGSVALLLGRPGGAPWTVSDRAWGRYLTRSAAALGGVVWPVQLAHRYGVTSVADVFAEHRRRHRRLTSQGAGRSTGRSTRQES